MAEVDPRYVRGYERGWKAGFEAAKEADAEELAKDSVNRPDRVSGDLAYADAVVSEADLLLAVLDPFIEALAAKPERTKDGREAQEIDIETGWAQIDKLRTAIADYRKRRPVR